MAGIPDSEQWPHSTKPDGISLFSSWFVCSLVHLFSCSSMDERPCERYELFKWMIHYMCQQCNQLLLNAWAVPFCTSERDLWPHQSLFTPMCWMQPGTVFNFLQVLLFCVVFTWSKHDPRRPVSPPHGMLLLFTVIDDRPFSFVVSRVVCGPWNCFSQFISDLGEVARNSMPCQ